MGAGDGCDARLKSWKLTDYLSWFNVMAAL
jgi:hypothetical protein